mmetsp:Transcript_10695/g.16784  ORF Transcript_10695/g.16784 Transcript_10695/m.16784 type:complete len:95 (-) Transcript_10695:727-1011(-)
MGCKRTTHGQHPWCAAHPEREVCERDMQQMWEGVPLELAQIATVPTVPPRQSSWFKASIPVKVFPVIPHSFRGTQDLLCLSRLYLSVSQGGGEA